MKYVPLLPSPSELCLPAQDLQGRHLQRDRYPGRVAYKRADSNVAVTEQLSPHGNVDELVKACTLHETATDAS